jgi:hypothetical protein
MAARVCVCVCVCGLGGGQERAMEGGTMMVPWVKHDA